MSDSRNYELAVAETRVDCVRRTETVWWCEKSGSACAGELVRPSGSDTGPPAMNRSIRARRRHGTHRTWGQKLRMWTLVATLVAIPLLLLSGGVALTLSRYFGPPKVRPAAQPTAAEYIRKLPNFKDLKIERNHLDVGELRVEHSGPGARMLGQVKNLTDREIPRAEIDCGLWTRDRALVGSTTVVVEHVPASGTKRFEVNLEQTTTAFVEVREVRAQEVKAQ